MNLRKILLIEQDANLAFTLSNSMKYYGYDVVTAPNSNSAINIFHNDSSIGFIVTDIDLRNGVNDIQTAIIINNHREVPTIFWTETADRKAIRQVRKSFHHGYVIKKLDIYSLLSIIKLAGINFEARYLSQVESFV